MDIKKELIEGIIQELVKFLCEDKSFTIEKSMNMIYNSLVFDKLYDTETGLYKESASYVYELLIDELNEGKLIQKEQ
ncbi:hypothetical protein [Clostridium uliginosum]|uniref:Uncharacterized protein n=1 Tax=Clostridium uliginosum TaxID=119641 RepID=A0A1I1IN42_9CLOT|nr:hypothetical protein [Clostridium uliginosum]SFC37709.1 hypothetical protein SAMN05421842_10319 [Clostridium uliginosum]